MENNRKTVRKRSVRLLSALLVTVMLFAVALSGVALAANAPIDLEAPCFVTVLPAAADSEMYEDAMTADVVIDLYLVAAAKAVPNYDTYAYDTPSGAFSTLTIKDEMSASDWADLAQAAAAIALDTEAETPMAPTASGEAGSKITDAETGLAPGLYLIVAHGKDLDLEDYVEIVDDEIVTLAYSDEYKYSFGPQLVSLPTKEAEYDEEAGEDVIKTSNSGPWIYDPTVNMKPTREHNKVGLTITKTLNEYATFEGQVDPAVFTFQIEATLKNKNVYSNAVSMTFTGSGSQSVTLEKVVPVGAEVTVTEIYDGSRYKLTTTSPVTKTITADEIAEFSFTNTHDDTPPGGGGISNHFVFDGEEWIANPEPVVEEVK